MNDKKTQGRLDQGLAQKQPQHGRPNKGGHGHDPHRHHSQGPGASRSAGVITAITAPYNFVPLSSWVHIPEWSAAVNHDLPFEDGLCGELAIEILAETPLLIGGEKAGSGNAVRPCQLPDKRYVIPGASLKGMVRNVLEIATFGRMGAVDDQQFALRDLSGPTKKDYQEKFAAIGSKMDSEGRRQKTFIALPETGWLKYANGEWRLTPCEHARVDHDILDKLLRGEDAPDNVPGPFEQIRESSKPEPRLGSDDANPKLPILKYRRYIDFLGKKLSKGPSWKWLQVHCEMENQAYAQRHSADKNGQHKYLYYRRVTRVGNGTHTGHLVFTGQPGPNKHMEFLFYEGAQPGEPIPVLKNVMQAFLDLHNPSKESNSGQRPPASVVWDFHTRERPYGERGTPVFFLRDAKGGIASMGLAQMYRLPYTLTVGQAIRNTQKQTRQGEADFCEALFGHIAEETGNGLRSRVSFGHAVAQGQVQPEPLSPTVLNGPKASYFPNYICQTQCGPQGDRLRENGQYTTLMSKEARVRGWKRYPVRGRHKLQALTPDQQKNRDIQTQLNPLPAGTRFDARIRFHNLLPEELGALVWALTWGGGERYRHALGMGKPFGMGQVKLHISSCRIVPNRPERAAPSLEACMALFAAHMEAAHAAGNGQKSWCASKEIRTLLAMANPAVGASQTLAHLPQDERNNAFLRAKKDSLVLPDYPMEPEPA